MNDFLSAEASYLEAPECIEPTIDDVSMENYHCETDECEERASVEISWPMEDHDLVSGYFCKACYDKLEAANFEHV